MNIRREYIKESTLEDFADSHGIVLVVTERTMDEWQRKMQIKRFTARFEHSEIMDGQFLVSTYGNGDTEEAAIRDYAGHISQKRLVLNAGSASSRVEIEVPRLVPLALVPFAP